MAVGILTVGLLLVATMFPLGIHFTTISVERTMAAIVADEAFAKVQLRGLDIVRLQSDSAPGMGCQYLRLYLNLPFDDSEFAYPSVDLASGNSQYYWSGICRKLVNDIDETSVQVTIFVGRKKAVANTYGSGNYPIFYTTNVTTAVAGFNEITTGSLGPFINPPTTIIEATTGRLYRVVKRDGTVLTLDRDWETDMPTSTDIRFLRPPDGVGGVTTATGANPDVGVFQRIIKF